MAKAYKCDRCGVYFDKLTHQIKDVNPSINMYYNTYDLCDLCKCEFEEWMKEHQDEKLS